MLGLAARLSGDGSESGHRFRERREARTSGVRARLPEPRNADDHEFRVVLMEGVGCEAPAFERPRTEVLDQDIRGREELARDLRTLGEIERYTRAASQEVLNASAIEKQAANKQVATLPLRIGNPAEKQR